MDAEGGWKISSSSGTAGAWIGTGSALVSYVRKREIKSMKSLRSKSTSQHLVLTQQQAAGKGVAWLTNTFGRSFDAPTRQGTRLM